MIGVDCARGFRARVRVWTRILLVTMLVTMLAAGSAHADVVSSENSNRAVALTLSFASVAAQYKAADDSARAALGAQLLDLAAARRTALLGLIDDAPGDVLKAELPSRIANRLPAEVRDLLEYRGVLEGALTVVQIDHEEPEKSFLEYSLVTDFGERVSLHFASKPTQLLTGARVIARGLILDGDEDSAIVLGSGDTDLEVAFCCEGDGGGGGSAPELPNTLGAQSTAVLLVNFTDDTSQPWTVAEIETLMFGQVSDYFYEVSHNQTWLTGDVFGWLTIELPADTCEIYEFSDRVAQAAANAGIDLSPYDRQVIFTPRRPECWYVGLATIGGSPSVTRLDGVTGVNVITHEMGHNLGLYHSHLLNCGLETMTGDCVHDEYGDKTDAMGGQVAGHYNTFQKQRLGWLGDSVPGTVDSVTSSGTHTLDVYETLPGSNPKSIRLPAGVDAVTGAQRWMYLTYRQPVGFDSFYAERSFSTYCRDDVTEGVYAHLGTDGVANSSYLLNMRTNSCWVDFYGKLDQYNPRLAPGESFTIPDTGATITVDSVSPAGATVFVDLAGAPPCVTGNPLVDVAPVGGNWGEPGETVSYTVTVISTDSSACGIASFDLSADALSGWAAGFADLALALGPGESGSTTLDLTSDSGAADGAYDVPVTAANGSSSGSATATYVVSGAVANQPPVAQDDSATTDSKTPVTIPVLANDYDPDGDPLTVTVVGSPKKGTVSQNADGSITYTPGAKAKGSDSFDYWISDGAGTASATVEIAFAKGSGGGGSGGGGKGNGKGPNK